MLDDQKVPGLTDDLDNSKVLDAALVAARRAGDVLRDGLSDARNSVMEKANVVDLVTEIDRQAEAVVVETIRHAFPDDGIIGEEGTNRPSSTNRHWIIDPLDGTSNYVRGWRVSAVSIGVEIDGVLTVGVVYNPLSEELFQAVTGEGAWLNGQRLSTDRSPAPFEAAFVGMDGGYMPWARQQRAIVAAEHLIPGAGELRMAGSTALSMCHVAMGRLDGHVNIGSSVWDIAAGTVIAREAGCSVEGLHEGSHPTAHHTITASPHLIDRLRAAAIDAGSRAPTGLGPGEEPQ